jgi:Protein of unknown function (DUF1064)
MSAINGTNGNGYRGPSKYHAVVTHVDGLRFSSKAEAKRYAQLVMMQKAGLIKDLVLQPHYRLHAPGTKVEWQLIGEYVADFDYVDVVTDKQITEDVKGVKTPVYQWKKKHFQAEYGRPIFEVTV